MNGGNVIGQTLDGKYRIESEIGKGGMGTVYLATHVGTERPVAVKVIASEFMQRQEFVERFRREARAAGRLRHPNVVNVTDFGFSRTDKSEVAYLVMEYLDGCTLGEVLEEEKQLPLSWTLNILEQVCSAVQEAHEQGIIHRDLKPDNIWLEPNQRGGYTVKVLDFGIAKLEEQINGEIAAHSPSDLTALSTNFQSRATIADAIQPPTIVDHRNQTAVSEAATIAQFAAADSEAGTLIQPNRIDSESGTLIHSNEIDLESGTLIQPNEVDLESGTAIFPAAPPRSLANTENVGTKLISEQIETDENLRRTASTSELTRVGAILGTPLYMSPEQCRGEKLTAQSDIYSLGVIAFQMLSGKTPFGGNYLEVMAAHKETAAPPLDVKKIPKKVRQVVNSALAKNIAERPSDAQSFASELRAQSEGIGALYRRALVIYSEHLPKFLGLATLLYLPIAVFTLIQLIIGFLSITDRISDYTKIGLSVFVTIISTFLGIFCGYLIFGTTTWLVSQILAVPLRPVKVRPALKASWQRRRTFAGTGMMTAILTLLGYGFCLAPGLVFSVVWALVAPVVMMENLRGRAALKRSKMLVRRSLRTTIAVVFLMFFVPLIFSVMITFFANAAADSFQSDADKITAAQKRIEKQNRKKAAKDAPAVENPDENDEVSIRVNGNKVQVDLNDESQSMGAKIRETVREALTQILLLPFQIIIGSFSSIIIALLYLKTRQVGGESMQDLLAQFEQTDQPRTNWQKRVQARLEQTGKLTSKT